MIARIILAVLTGIALAASAAAQPPPPSVQQQSSINTYCWNGTSVAMCGGGVANGGSGIGHTASVCVTPTITAANGYGAKFVVGGKLTFANAFSATGTGILQGVVVTIRKVEAVTFTFVPFIVDPTNTTWTDAAVAAINAADVPNARGAVPLANYSDLGTHTIASANALGAPLAPGTTSLWGVLIVSGALTNQFAAGDVRICVQILQDP